MTLSRDYVKIVRWSEADQCFVGSCPGLFYGGCHGLDERAVYSELCEIVEETLVDYRAEGRSVPPPTAVIDLASLIENSLTQR